ncbi:hypothetical protein B0H10DRAFT_777839 [Mycena sp. CBHHK59/15]|nr:hypothetical protein B0H10DRAFT_777839 [Mycena sp. CBHHK59/15]
MVPVKMTHPRHLRSGLDGLGPSAHCPLMPLTFVGNHASKRCDLEPWHSPQAQACARPPTPPLSRFPQMPVSFKVAEHSPNPVTLTPAQIHPGLTPEQLLAGACAHQYETAGEILGSSFSKATPAEKSPFIRRLTNPFAKKKKAASGMASEPLPLTIPNIIPTPNGLVNTIISAYNRHHNLILRPDDVWLAILTQFNFYVNANAELLRANFVAHEGRQELKVSKQQSRATMDFGQMSREMVGLMTSVIVDPTLQAWVLPDFSTTTTNDRTVAAIVMMSTLKAYFEYVFESIECGIPQVTLAGEKADWENILQRLEKLKEYGIETIAWYHLLVPVISRFVEAFDDPSGSANVDFWQKVAHFQPGGSGPSHYSGWISAFCVFNEEGGWIGNRLKESVGSFQ